MAPSARSLLQKHTAYRKTFGRRKPLIPGQVFGKYNRRDKVTEIERGLVTQFLQDQPHEITPRQVKGLADTLRRSKETILRVIEETKDTLGERVGRYADLHMQATETAVTNGDAKSLAVATKAAEWAMENIGVDGRKVIEKTESRHSGPNIQIGVKIGGGIEPKVECLTIPPTDTP